MVAAVVGIRTVVAVAAAAFDATRGVPCVYLSRTALDSRKSDEVAGGATVEPGYAGARRGGAAWSSGVVAVVVNIAATVTAAARSGVRSDEGVLGDGPFSISKSRSVWSSNFC